MNEHALPEQDHCASTDPYKALDDLVHAQLAESSMGLSPIALVQAQADWAMHLAASPGRQALLARMGCELGLQAWTNSVGAADARPTDPRFADESWQHWPFSAWKEVFLATEAWWREAVKVEGMSSHHRHMVEFFCRQAVDALSPANWAPTNPVVLKAAFDSGGRSGLKGWQRFVDDLMQANRHSRKAQADADDPALPPQPHQVGKDVAVTPGKVVFRSRLFELIQYTATTTQVYAEPLLIVPSCIMKYYILDLSPENSMVRYLVGQGFTVFIMSWRNPDQTDRDLGMQDYLQHGVMEAMAAVKACSGAGRIHALGYCLGGTFLAIVAAVLGRLQRQAAAATAAVPQRRRSDGIRPESLPELATVTLLAAQTDFTEPGELGVFIDDDQLKTLRETMDRIGYLSGRGMAGSFQFLNSRDLVWSRNVHRYLLGLDETGNDMMSWNADVTRLPARMHSEYLSSLFLNNALTAGQYRVGGEAVALKDIHAPVLAVGTVRDHVSPWRSVYKLHLFTDAPITFVLAAGGHNAGIVSEPGHARRSYQMADVDNGQGWTEPETWLAQAPMHQGSWWVAMADWLGKRSSGLCAPPAIAPEQVLCDAPGTYVMVRYND